MYVYATHPYQYNDPFDCNELLIEFDSWDGVKGLWEDLYDELIKEHPTLDSACEESRKAYWYLLYKKLGLVSLTSSLDNYQMWSLYAQNSGFCVEFDVDKFPFLHYGPFPINYAKTIHGPVKIGKVGGQIAMLIQTNVKNDWWKYENEWRLYVPNPPGFDLKYFGNEYDMSRLNRGDEHDRKFKYPLDALISVTLGPKFFERIARNIISPNEAELTFALDDNSYELKVLDFLAKISQNHPLQIRTAILSDFSKYEFQPTEIRKFSTNKFRIII